MTRTQADSHLYGCFEITLKQAEFIQGNEVDTNQEKLPIIPRFFTHSQSEIP